MTGMAFGWMGSNSLAEARERDEAPAVGDQPGLPMRARCVPHVGSAALRLRAEQFGEVTSLPLARSLSARFDAASISALRLLGTPQRAIASSRAPIVAMRTIGAE